MALSNIEPRREITESLVGLSAVGLFVWGDYAFARWFNAITTMTNPDNPCPVVVGMLCGGAMAVCGTFIAVTVALATHALGDGICNRLGRFDPRPKVRR